MLFSPIASLGVLHNQRKMYGCMDVSAFLRLNVLARGHRLKEKSLAVEGSGHGGKH